MRPRRAELLCAAALSALVAFLFFPALCAGQVLWYRDIYSYWLAQSESFVRVVASGAPPLWNPYVSFGMPMLADPSYQVLYPPTWLNLVLPPSTYYTLYAVSHTLLSGFGMLLLGRRLALGVGPSLVAAASWIASGPFLSVTSQTHHFGSTAIIPWVLLALEHAVATRTRRAALALAGVAALQVFAGSAEVCLMTACAALGHCLLQPGARSSARARLRLAAIAVPFALAFSAPQWLPMLGILTAGQRPSLGAGARLFWSLHPVSLCDLVAPRLVSRAPWSASLQEALFGSREPLFLSVYLGGAAAVLVASGLVGPWCRARTYASLGFALSMIAALGRFTPLYRVLAAWPPLSLMRYPAKFTIAAAFFWALLLGAACRDLRDDPGRPRRRAALIAALALGAAALAASLVLLVSPASAARWLDASAQAALAATGVRLVAAAAGLALAGGLAWFASRESGTRLPARALAVLVVADLALAGRAMLPFAPSELLRARPPLAHWIPAGARVYLASGDRDLPESVARRPLGWTRPWAFALGNIQLLRPPSAARWGLFGSYDGDFTGLAPPLLSNMTLVVEHAAGTTLGHRLLRVGGVDYVVALGSLAWPGLDQVASSPSVFGEPVTLWRVRDARPRASLVTSARVAAEPDSVRLLGAADFDPEREVILAAGSPRTAPNAPAAGVALVRQRADLARYDVSSPQGGFLVVRETFYPGWQALVDGAAAPIVRADVLFRAVELPPGRHAVEFRYRPRSVIVGLGACAAALLAACILAAIASRAREHAA